MNRKSQVLLFTLSLALAQLACATLLNPQTVTETVPAQSTVTPAPKPSSTPLPEPTATEATGVLFYDDFTRLGMDWTVPRSNTITGDLHLSGYRLSTSAPDIVYWLPVGAREEDMRVEVDVQQLVGGDTSEVGLLCRYLSDADFYAATINTGGNYSIYKLRARNWVQLASGFVKLPENGLGKARLTLDCIGEVLAFFINDQLIALAYDSEFRLGKGGVFIFSAQDQNTEFLFDDFTFGCRRKTPRRISRTERTYLAR